MKAFITRKIALVVTVVTASLGLSANKISADVGITKLADILQINVTGKWSTLRFIGLTSKNTLVNIDPSGFAKVIKVKEIDGNLQGIDFRPANGLLYGVTDTDNIYTINSITGQATFVSKLSSSFNGGFQSGFDFNPVPDRLRIVGSNDQNFRTNVDTGAVTADKTLAYATDDVNAKVDPNITAVAYINSVARATSTQLFGIDYDLDVLVLQNPPNDGTLRTIGKLGANFAPISGFDIFTNAQGKNTGYALSGSVLYTINLSTGTATKIATVPKGNFIGLAVTSK
ncbi:DUF4394 domain-containing protein [Nostoc cf. edaphicum LEGE 07299]|uniref:DUF4394 domain-containing protein n=1 Tax=Nostoc cf. edaphicum LEGE 07299 TaxID=2777974 RepID=A0ABR9TXL5_9NOSO|nr:DUF4394 domain-containing protein [Nostoc edaphicum]MBE9105166.1 DUF4394 domain-containing protein [Nostoc cf. edaphicum LEGE 07299]